MLRAGGPSLLFSLLTLASAPTAAQAAPDLGHALHDAGIGETRSCKSEDPRAVVVCGTARQPFRIDPTVLAATREAEAAPIKPPVGGDVSQAVCSGPRCGPPPVPLVGMALAALKAAALAAQGDDWREPLRTHPDQYKVYEQKKSASKPRVSVEVGAGNK